MASWTRKPVSDYIGKSYLSAGNSLRTIDWSKKVQLLNNYNDTKSKPNVTKENHDEISRSILFSGTNLLSKKECEKIVQTCVEQKLQKMETQYKSGRNNSRFIVFDSLMANYIWQKLQTVLGEAIDCTNLVPFGFDVLRGDWELSGVNEAIRFNQYNCKKNEFFSVHRDSQFCPSGDERSVFSIVIYLNDGYSGGETVFYFPKNSCIESKGLNIIEEIANNQGLDKGYEKVIIKPKCGNFVIFTPNILHESVKIEDNDSVQNKYIIKTDIMMKRSGKKFGFSVSFNEQDDYFQCMKIFRDAQSHELDNLHEKACTFYEVCLSIRYSYPTKEMILEHSVMNGINYSSNISIENEDTENKINVISTVMKNNQKKDCNSSQESYNTNSYRATSGCECEVSKLTADIWLEIMLFLEYTDIHNLTVIFPHLSSFNRILYKAYIIPSIELRDGVFTKFSYKSYNFVKNNIEGCCRVLAMYSVYLLGHSRGNNTYTVNYNPETNEVTSIPLNNLLYSVFYEEPSYGSIFKVKQGDDLTMDVENDFFNSVDRYFMLLRYGKEYLGIDVAEEFCCNLKAICNNYSCNVCNNFIYGETECRVNEPDSDEEYPNIPAFERDSNGIINLDGNNFHTLCKYDRIYNLHEGCGEMFDYCEEDEPFRKYISRAREQIEMIHPTYDEQLILAATKANNIGAAIVRRLTKKVKSINESYGCECGIGYNIPSSLFSDACDTMTFNHLIIDFNKQNLKVYEETNDVDEDLDIDEDDIETPAENKCCFLASCLQERVKCNLGDVDDPNIFGLFKVNIEAICGDDFSFNHASCQCASPTFEVNDYVNLQSYPYLNHLHTLFVKNEKCVGDEEVTGWTCYGGIVCL